MEEMRKGACRELLHAGDTLQRPVPVQPLCHSLRDSVCRSSVKSRLQDGAQLISPLLVLFVPVIELHPGAPRLFTLHPQPFDQLRQPGLRRKFPVPERKSVLVCDSQIREKFLQLLHKVGWTDGLSVSGHPAVEDTQLPGRFGQVQVEIVFLYIGLLPAPRRQGDLLLLKGLHVPLGEKADPHKGARKEGVIGPHEDQGLHPLQPGPFHVSSHHLVDARRNDSHLGLRKPCIQQVTVLLQGDLFLAQKLHEFVKKPDDNTVDLGVLPGQSILSSLLESLLLLFQGKLHLLSGQEVIESLCDIADGLPPLAEHEKERLHLLHKEDTHVVESLQLLCSHTLRPADPALLPFFPSPDAKGHTIILQIVQLPSGKGSVSGAQKTEHAVTCKALPGHGKKTADILHKRIEQNAPLLIHENRDLIAGKGLFEIIAIDFHVAGDHADLPVPVPLPAHKGAHLPGGCLRLLVRAGCHMDLHTVLLTLKDRISISEKMILHKSQSRALLKSGRHLGPQKFQFFHRHMALPGDLHQRCDRLFAHGKQLIRMVPGVGIFPSVDRHCDDHIPADGQELSQKTVLYGRKPGVTVQHHCAPPQQGGIPRHFCQHIQQLFLCGVLSLQIVLEAPVEKF